MYEIQVLNKGVETILYRTPEQVDFDILEYVVYLEENCCKVLSCDFI
jgi:hypothetical protein